MNSHSAWYTHARKAMEAWKRTSQTLPAAARAPGMCLIEKAG